VIFEAIRVVLGPYIFMCQILWSKNVFCAFLFFNSGRFSWVKFCDICTFENTMKSFSPDIYSKTKVRKYFQSKEKI